MDAPWPRRLAVAGDRLLSIPLPRLWLSIPTLYAGSPLT
jgi:hypothetical protein